MSKLMVSYVMERASNLVGRNIMASYELVQAFLKANPECTFEDVKVDMEIINNVVGLDEEDTHTSYLLSAYTGEKPDHTMETLLFYARLVASVRWSNLEKHKKKAIPLYAMVDELGIEVANATTKNEYYEVETLDIMTALNIMKASAIVTLDAEAYGSSGVITIG